MHQNPYTLSLPPRQTHLYPRWSCPGVEHTHHVPTSIHPCIHMPIHAPILTGIRSYGHTPNTLYTHAPIHAYTHILTPLQPYSHTYMLALIPSKVIKPHAHRAWTHSRPNTARHCRCQTTSLSRYTRIHRYIHTQHTYRQYPGTGIYTHTNAPRPR